MKKVNGQMKQVKKDRGDEKMMTKEKKKTNKGSKGATKAKLKGDAAKEFFPFFSLNQKKGT